MSFERPCSGLKALWRYQGWVCQETAAAAAEPGLARV
jgi:hypothetical protein